MNYQPNYSTARGRSVFAILLIVLICSLGMPFLVSGDVGDGELPNPIPPPNGEDLTIPDTTFIIPDGEDSTFYYGE